MGSSSYALLDAPQQQAHAPHGYPSGHGGHGHGGHGQPTQPAVDPLVQRMEALKSSRDEDTMQAQTVRVGDSRLAGGAGGAGGGHPAHMMQPPRQQQPMYQSPQSMAPYDQSQSTRSPTQQLNQPPPQPQMAQMMQGGHPGMQQHAHSHYR